MAKTVGANKGLIVGAAVSIYTANPSYAAAGYQYDQSAQQTKQQEIDLMITQDEESIAAKDQEISRRRRILEILALQNVGSAASGVAAFEGSNRNIMFQSEKYYQTDQLYASAMSKMRVSGQNTRMRNQRRATRINQASLIADTTYKGYKAGDFD